MDIEITGDKLQLSDLLGAIEKHPAKTSVSSGRIKRDIKSIAKKTVTNINHYIEKDK